MKTLLRTAIACFWVVGLVVAQEQTERKTFTIGVVFDGPWERNAELADLLRTEISQALLGQTQVSIPAEKVLVGDWTTATARELNDRLLSDPAVDLVVGFGVFTSQDLALRRSLPKPVIAPIIIDPKEQNIPLHAGTSGTKNLNYLVFPHTFLRDYKLLRELVPFKKLAYLTSRRYQTGTPGVRPPDEEIARMVGSGFVTIMFDDRADEALAAIPPDADAVFLDVVPLPRREFDKLVEGFIKRRLPSFSMLGETEVRRGVFAAANPDVFPRMIRRIALHVRRVASGEDAGTLPVTFPAGKRLFINLSTAYAIGVSPKWSTLMEAELVQIDTSRIAGAQQYTFESALQRIADSNLDVQAKVAEVAGQAENIGIARGNLLPRIDLSAAGLQIDQDRAVAGYQPEKRATADVSVSQVIFSEPALANLSIQSSLQDSRENDLQAVRLDAINGGARLYLNYLRARKAYYILLENLKLTRSNLELAQIRQSTGVAGPEEPLRWEAEVANIRKTVMEVNAQMNQALLALKQAMNIPLVYLLNISDVTREDPTLLASNRELTEYLEDPVSFDLLTDYLVQEGIARSPELRQLDAVIEAQQRGLQSTRYSYMLPSVVAFAGYTNTFYKTAVSSPFSLTSVPAPPPSIPAEFPLYLGQILSAASPKLPDRIDWNVGLKVSLNLFNGFGTRASEALADRQLGQYRLQRNSAEEKIALRIRYQMEKLKSSHFSIQQSSVEQAAAQKGLEITTEAYSRGAVSILSLLDAQNSALRANLLGMNAGYDFLVDYMELQRSIGEFDVLMTDHERQELLDRLLGHMRTALKKR